MALKISCVAAARNCALLPQLHGVAAFAHCFDLLWLQICQEVTRHGVPSVRVADVATRCFMTLNILNHILAPINAEHFDAMLRVALLAVELAAVDVRLEMQKRDNIFDRDTKLNSIIHSNAISSISKHEMRTNFVFKRFTNHPFEDPPAVFRDHPQPRQLAGLWFLVLNPRCLCLYQAPQ